MDYLKGPSVKLVKFTDRYKTLDYIGWLNDGEVNRYLCTGRLPVAKDDVGISNDNTALLFAIIAHSDELIKHIGTISLHHIDWIDRKCEVGYMIGSKDHWGRGIATEAVGLITNYAFNRLNFNKVSAGVVGGNAGSVKALERNGFKQYATEPQDYYLDGEYLDTHRFYKLQERR